MSVKSNHLRGEHLKSEYLRGNHLIDRFQRKINYLRISLTDRCNLRCIYCAQGKISFLSRDEILTYEEIFAIIQIAQELGIEKFRLTGGEPFLRRGLLEFLKKLANAGIKYSITTNGLLLRKYAPLLAEVGSGGVHLIGLNISLDTLDENKFTQITGKGSLPNILLGIETAEKVGLSPIKINTVVMEGINENEIENFISFFSGRKNFVLRFIEYMSFQSRKDVYLRDKKNGKDYFYPLTVIEEKLQKEGLLIPLSLSEEGAGPARYYQLKDKSKEGLKIGFITPRSRPFCGQCNRLRLTADGKLRSCLGSPLTFDLKKILRSEKNKDKIKEVFFSAVSHKPQGHEFRFQGEMMKIGG